MSFESKLKESEVSFAELKEDRGSKAMVGKVTKKFRVFEVVK